MATSATEHRPLTSQELLHAAMHRSQQRGRQVARRRLAGRWLLWCAGRVLRWGWLPALAVALWLHGGTVLAELMPETAPSPAPAMKTPAMVAAPASAATSASAPSAAAQAASAADTPIHLRLDADNAPAPVPRTKSLKEMSP
ncbi:MAG: hypothetical protein CFE46_05030 [Burkholderiales bacterium PBB6]|nr:MAG: hypothetical protein CFE46_05030 [Burkholderiales bacterium PBB6]